jgi:hypothetical protein
VLDTLWKKPLPNKLSHLERVVHRPDNLPLPTTITSLTWREVTHRLSMNLHWPVSHAQSSTAWPQQPTGKTDTGFPNRLNNHEIDSRFWFRDCTRCTEIPRTGSNCSDKECTGYLRNQHRLFGFQGCTRVFLQRSDGTHVQTVDGGMEEEPPSRLNSAVLSACAWVDTCHP